MPDRKKPKQRIADKLQMEMDFLTTPEAIEKIDKTATEEGYPDSGLMLADQGVNGIANNQETYIHKTVDQTKARKRLESNIRKINGGNDLWIVGHIK